MVRFGGKTEWTEEEPFYELLCHSDCDGELTWMDCKTLMEDFTDERRDAFIEATKEDEYYVGKYDLWEQFIRRCAENYGILMFCQVIPDGYSISLSAED